MWLSDVSVKRPVFATVISLMLIAFGALSFRDLAVREYPDVVQPVVQVSASYPGAAADIVETRVTQVLEGELSGIEGVGTIRSTSRDGQSSLNVEFELDRDLDEAANDVRDRVSRIAQRLPPDVESLTVSKSDSDSQPVMWLTLTSNEMDILELTDYMERYLLDRFAVIPGVSRIQVFGSGGPSMRVWIDPLAMAARNLTVSDIEAAVRRENLELPAGRVESLDRDFQIRMARNFQTADDFRNLVIAQGDDGHLIRLGEIARVEIGPRQAKNSFRTNGALTTGFGVVKQSKANTVEILDAVTAEVNRLNAGELPPGMALVTSGDDSLFIRAAISAVYWTIGITTALVGLVILVFLGSFRAMVIPLVTIPICLISSFSVLALFGYSINLITLLALVLSIGLVVDDSIVVIENAHRRIETGEPPLLAAFNGTRQVAFAVIATTVVLVAVFAPVAFLKDSVGRIFAELAVTISAAVMISSVLALSLAPMLCSKLFRSHAKESRAEQAVDRVFERLSNRYQRILRALLNLPQAAVLVSVLMAFGAYALLQIIPQEYSPAEDQGTFMGQIQAPEGTSYERIAREALAVEAPLQPYFDSGLIQRGIIGVPGWGNQGSGIVNVTLAPWDERETTTAELLAELNAKWSEIPDLQVTAFMRSSAPGGGGGGGGGQPVQIVIGGPNYIELARWRDIILERAGQNPGLQRLDSDLKETQPQVLLRIDTERAASLGVSAESIGRTLQAVMSERRIGTYVVDGEEYDIVLQAEADQRASYADLRSVFVRSERSGELIPLSNLTTLQDQAGPSQLNRYNRTRAVTISANLAPDYTLGEALDYLENIIRSELPETAQIDYRGESRDLRESSGSLLFTFGVALFVVFLVLAAQFESFVHPLVIMITVPLAVAGGLFGLWVAGMTLNIYSQIGIIMLVGIAAKNGVLIVEFINQMRDQGMEFRDAVVEGARVRFRPVLMTAFATVMGSVPLIMATGPGAVSRETLGVVIFSGVSIATLFTLFIVPAVYDVLARRTGSPQAVARKLRSMAERLAT